MRWSCGRAGRCCAPRGGLPVQVPTRWWWPHQVRRRRLPRPTRMAGICEQRMHRGARLAVVGGRAGGAAQGAWGGVGGGGAAAAPDTQLSARRGGSRQRCCRARGALCGGERAARRRGHEGPCCSEVVCVFSRGCRRRCRLEVDMHGEGKMGREGRDVQTVAEEASLAAVAVAVAAAASSRTSASSCAKWRRTCPRQVQWPPQGKHFVGNVESGAEAPSAD